MLRLAGDAERSAAVLHDVVEESGWTLEDLRREGFSDAVLAAVDSVTRGEGESYAEFVRRAGLDPIGRRVKIAGLEDNLDLARIAEPGPRDHARLKRYATALAVLRSP